MADKKKLRAAILKQAFDRAQKQNKAFSLRALAQKLDLSPGFVSKILSGKSELPFERINDFSEALKIDKISENRLLKSYSDVKTERIHGLAAKDRGHEDIMKNYIEMSDKHFFLLTKWYLIAILDLAGCEGFSIEPAWLAKRLRISVGDADEAIRFLKAQKFLVQNGHGDWIKDSKNIRFPTKQSRELIRGYHEMLMKKAIHTLQTQNAQKDFDQRLISGISMTCNPNNIEKAIARLNEAMYEVASILSEGDCKEVYHLGLQLFPVTSPQKD